MSECEKVITPQEARRLTTDQMGEIEAIVRKFNASMTGWDGNRKAVAAKLFGPYGTVREAVLRRIRDAGWRLEFVSHRDGDFYWVE